MSSEKAPADQQKASNPNPDNPPQQQPQQRPPTASMSYSRVAGNIVPATPKAGNSASTARKSGQPTQAAGLSAKAANAPSNSTQTNSTSASSTSSNASVHQTVTQQTLPLRSASQSCPHQHASSSKPSVDTSSASASGNSTACTDETNEGSNQTQQPPPKLGFTDESYAADAGEGTSGSKINIRVNRFNIVDDGSISHFYIYNVKFQPINGRDVKNSNVKKALMQEVLSMQQPWGQSASNDQVFTDWNNMIVTKAPLETLSSGAIPRNTSGVILAPYVFHNQSSQGPPINNYAEVDLQNRLDMSEFRAYIRCHPLWRTPSTSARSSRPSTSS